MMTTPRWRKSSYSGSQGNCVEVARLQDWRKSSYSGESGNCVEVARLDDWRKSSYSGSQGNCVELAETGDAFLVRNSNHPDTGTLTLTRTEMDALVRGIKAGQLDQHV